jgi:transposase
MRTGRPRTLQVLLTPEEQHQLETWTREPTVPPGQARRSRVLLLLAAGHPVTQIAPRVGLSRQGVYSCLRRFQHGGVEALRRARGGRPPGATNKRRGKRPQRPRTGRPRTFVLVLTPEDRQQLTQWARATTGPQGLARRSRLLLLLAGKEPMTQVAHRVGLSRPHAYKWLWRFQQEGLAGLAAHPSRKGRPPKEPSSVTPRS